MKTQLLSFIKNSKMIALTASCFFYASADAQSWGSQSTSLTDNINGISFDKNTNNGIAVGAGGRIITTDDGGLTWILQNSTTARNLHAVHMITSSSAVAVGDSGLVLYSNNGTSNWTQVPSGTSESLKDVHMSNADGFIVGDNGVILKISGTSISSTNSNTTNNLTGVYTLDASTAYVTGGGLLNSTLLATFNGGSVWTALSPGTINQLNAVHFVNDSTGFAVGNLGTILKTTDNGSTWSSQTAATASNLNSVYFVTMDSGFAVGATGAIIRTVNGGNSWTALTSGTTSTLNDVSFPANYEGYAGGNGGTILKTCPTVNFNILPNDSICQGETVTFDNESYNADIWAWVMDGDTVSTSPNYFDTYDSAGVYSMTLIADNGTCSSSRTKAFYISEPPTVDLGPDTTICNTCTITLDAGNPGSDYVWYKDGVATGVVSRTNTVGIAGVYSVKVTTQAGCEEWDSVQVSIATGISEMENIRNFSLYPNPNNKVFNLGFSVNGVHDAEIKIMNYMGMTVYTETINDLSGAYSRNISLEGYSAGVYFVNVTIQGRTRSLRMITH